MKKELQAKAKRAKQMAEIAYLSYLVNAETNYCVFFEYSGHVDLVRVQICQSKDRYNEEIASSDHYRSDGDKIDWLASKIAHLKHILETGNVDYGRMNRTVSQVLQYEF